MKRQLAIRVITLGLVLLALLGGSTPAFAAGASRGHVAARHQRAKHRHRSVRHPARSARTRPPKHAATGATGSPQRPAGATSRAGSGLAGALNGVTSGVTGTVNRAVSGLSGGGSGSSPDPSGVAMPAGNLPGWREVFSDDFTGSSLDSQWTSYWGVPGGDPGGFFDPTHVTVGGGALAISAYKDPRDNAWDAGPNTYVTGGVSSSSSFAQTYGKYLVRFRFDSGVGISHAILLWPANNVWPPEIDFSEDNGANRQTEYATLHYGSHNTQVQAKLAVNLTQWHTLGVEWTPGKLVYTLDGKSWATINSANVPSTPMNLDIQTQSWACGTSTWEQCPNATTPAHVNLNVDWVVAYAQG